MNPEHTFAVLTPELRIKPIDRTPTIYEELDTRFNNFKSHVLVSSYLFESDWGVWERHPAYSANLQAHAFIVYHPGRRNRKPIIRILPETNTE